MNDSTLLEFPVWPKQRLLLTTYATELLWGGAAGPGKSHGTRIALMAWCVAVPGLQCYLFRREYADVIRNHLEGPTGFRALLQPLVELGRVIIREREIEFVEERSKIFLCHCQHEKDVFGYQGAEMHVLVLEEATQFTEFQIRYLRSRVRMPDTVEIPDMFRLPDEYQDDPERVRYCFPRIVYPTNPGGIGHNYLFRAIWKPAQERPPYETWRAPDDDGGFIRQFVPARLSDNPAVDPAEYAKRLAGIGSPQYVRALLNGDWSVILGAFFSELDEDRHYIEPIDVPQHWFRYAWYDWGYSSPAACVWAAVSDGEPVWTRSGQRVSYPRGALILYREVYLCDPHNTAVGARLSNREQAQRLLAAARGETVSGYLADSKPFQNAGGICPATEFLEEGIRLLPGDTSRQSGWSLVHSRLQADPPMLYITRDCPHTWRTMGALQTDIRNPEDADSGGEDHLPDCVRGLCTVRRVVRDRDVAATDSANAAARAAAARKPTFHDFLKARGDSGLL